MTNKTRQTSEKHKRSKNVLNG